MNAVVKVAQLVANAKLAKDAWDEGSKLVPQPIKDEAKEQVAKLGKQAGKVALSLAAKYAPGLKKKFDDQAAIQRQEQLKAALAQTRAQAAALRRQEEMLAAELEGGATPARKRAPAKKAVTPARKR